MPAIQLRLGVFSAALVILAATSSGALAQKKYDTGATDTEIKIGNIMPYSGPASSYGVIGKTEEAYFKKINAEGGINGRKINFISYDDGYSSAEDGGAGPQAGGKRRGAVHLQFARHAAEFGDPEIHELEEGAAAFRRHRRHQMERPEGLSVDDGLAAQLPERGPDLREVHSQEQAERQDRGALSERRLRQGLSERLQGRARRQGSLDDRRRGKLRDHRAHHRLAHRQASRRAAPTCSSMSSIPKFAAQAIKKVAEIEWKPLHFLNNVSASIGATIKPAGFDRLAGHHLVGLHQGPDRSAVEGRSGHEERSMRSWTSTIRKPTAPTPT